jgi:hypothetical protein
MSPSGDSHRAVFTDEAGIEVDLGEVMTNNLSTVTVTELDILELDRVVGGANLDWNGIKAKAQPYCPQTVAKYSKVDPSKVDRPMAEQMGQACLAEMGPFKATFARGQIEDGINQLFPKK